MKRPRTLYNVYLAVECTKARYRANSGVLGGFKVKLYFDWRSQLLWSFCILTCMLLFIYMSASKNFWLKITDTTNAFRLFLIAKRISKKPQILSWALVPLLFYMWQEPTFSQWEGSEVMEHWPIVFFKVHILFRPEYSLFRLFSLLFQSSLLKCIKNHHTIYLGLICSMFF